jgi:hypothetical protein
VGQKYAFTIEASEHAELSASATERWATCTGSPSLIKGLPNHSTFYAAEGTAAHHVSAECLRNFDVTPAHWLGKKAKVEGHEIEMDEEFIEYVQDYLNDIAAYRQAGDIEFIEQSFTEAMKKLHPKFGGSADYVNFRPSTRRLRVEDLKFGAGVAVDVDDNKQLKYYALGALLANPQFNAEDVEIRIAQPRCEHDAGRFRSYTFPAMELVEYAADLIAAAKETEDPFQAKLVPSKKACKFCPANAANTCPAAATETHLILVQDFSAIEPERWSAEQIGEFLAKLPLAEARIAAVREFAYQEALKGTKFPGQKLVEKQARRKWTDEQEVAAIAEIVLGDDAYKKKLRSPKQIEDLLGKKKFAEEFGSRVDKSSSGYTLVSDADPRAPAQVAQISDFSVVDENAEAKQ